MENNEDEPDDVEEATPVEDVISDGSRDEKNRSVELKGSKQKFAPSTLSDREEYRGIRCDLFRGKFPPPQTKTKKPCNPKAEIICREYFSQDEYTEVLSTPKKNRGLSCKSTSIRKRSCEEKPMSQRLEELSKPKPSHVVNLLKSWGSRLRPEIIDAVQQSVEKNCPMSPEQLETCYNDKEADDCGRVRRVRRKKYSAGKEKRKLICDDGLDPEAVLCEEYEMAQRFMRHIISQLKNCPFAPEDHYDLTEVILSQLVSVLDYRPSGDGDRKFQMMFTLANGIACWVHGLNIAVAEKIAKQQAEDTAEAIETEESEDENVEEEQNEVTEPIEEEDEGEDKADDTAPIVEERKEDEEKKEEMPLEIENDNPLENEAKEEDEPVDPEDLVQETEEVKEESVEPSDVTEDVEKPKINEEIEDRGEAKKEKETTGKIEKVEDKEDVGYMEGMEGNAPIESPIDPGLAIQGLGEDDLFASEIPFIPSGKIMETVVKFLEKFEEAETTEVRRQLQNAILKKLINLVVAEAPDALDRSMKAVLEVLAENIAVLMEATLPKSRVNDIETMAQDIESTEVRNWGSMVGNGNGQRDELG